MFQYFKRNPFLNVLLIIEYFKVLHCFFRLKVNSSLSGFCTFWCPLFLKKSCKFYNYVGFNHQTIIILEKNAVYFCASCPTFLDEYHILTHMYEANCDKGRLNCRQNDI